MELKVIGWTPAGSTETRWMIANGKGETLTLSGSWELPGYGETRRVFMTEAEAEKKLDDLLGEMERIVRLAASTEEDRVDPEDFDAVYAMAMERVADLQGAMFGSDDSRDYFRAAVQNLSVLADIALDFADSTDPRYREWIEERPEEWGACDGDIRFDLLPEKADEWMDGIGEMKDEDASHDGAVI